MMYHQKKREKIKSELTKLADNITAKKSSSSKHSSNNSTAMMANQIRSWNNNWIDITRQQTIQSKIPVQLALQKNNVADFKGYFWPYQS